MLRKGVVQCGRQDRPVKVFDTYEDAQKECAKWNTGEIVRWIVMNIKNLKKNNNKRNIVGVNAIYYEFVEDGHRYHGYECGICGEHLQSG